MRRLFLMCLAAVLLTAGFANANTVWNPTDPNVTAFGYSDWSIAANWASGLPGEAAPLDTKAVFNVANRIECRVTNSDQRVGRLSLADGGAATLNNVLRIMNGGKLTVSGTEAMYIGYNRDMGNGAVIVEKGGQLIREGSSNSHIWVGQNSGGVGKLIINGGYVKVKDAVDLGRNDGSKGFVTINSGLLRFRYFDAADSPGSLWDIRFGTLATENNYLARPSNIWSRIDAGTIKAFGGKGTLVVTREPLDGTTLTCVRAIHPMIPYPAYKSTVADGTVNLSWTNMDPNYPGDPVYVDVWFGTDPNKLNPLVYSKKVTAGLNTMTVQVNAPVVGTAPTTYYWQVDSYLNGAAHINEPNMIKGDVFQFDVTNDYPPTVVIDDPITNMVTWANQPVQIYATVTDTGSSDMTYTWTSNPAGVVFSNPTGVNGDPDTTATVNSGTFPTTYTLTCSVKDAVNPTVTNTATRNITVYATACTAARRNAAGLPASDINADCNTDLTDLFTLLTDWTTDYTILAPTPY